MTSQVKQILGIYIFVFGIRLIFFFEFIFFSTTKPLTLKYFLKGYKCNYLSVSNFGHTIISTLVMNTCEAMIMLPVPQIQFYSKNDRWLSMLIQSTPWRLNIGRSSSPLKSWGWIIHPHVLGHLCIQDFSNFVKNAITTQSTHLQMTCLRNNCLKCLISKWLNNVFNVWRCS